jgi:hypothetical protein
MNGLSLRVIWYNSSSECKIINILFIMSLLKPIKIKSACYIKAEIYFIDILSR